MKRTAIDHDLAHRDHQVELYEREMFDAAPAPNRTRFIAATLVGALITLAALGIAKIAGAF